MEYGKTLNNQVDIAVTTATERGALKVTGGWLIADSKILHSTNLNNLKNISLADDSQVAGKIFENGQVTRLERVCLEFTDGSRCRVDQLEFTFRSEKNSSTQINQAPSDSRLTLFPGRQRGVEIATTQNPRFDLAI